MKLPRFSGKPRRRPSWLLVRRVVGESMVPNLKAGRIVVGWPRFRALEVGDVVIVRHAGLEKIKRVQQIRGDQLFLVGDNLSHSSDSRSFGWLHASVVQGKVVWPRSLATSSRLGF